MSNDSAIEWTGSTWNPVSGCTKVSDGCDHCYAERITERFHGKGSFARVTLHPERLDTPLRWRKSRRVFVNSMSDLFHQDVPDEFIGSVFDVMARTPRHIFQILTKRHGRMRSLLNHWADDDWTWRRGDAMWCGPLRGPLSNVHLGVSVEDQRTADLRLPALERTPASVRFISAEPLLGPVNLDRHLPSISWVIVGGESGAGARPMELDWVRSLVTQCQNSQVPVFVKQLGSVWAGRGKGGDMDAWPADLRVREFPVVAP